MIGAIHNQPIYNNYFDGIKNEKPVAFELSYDGYEKGKKQEERGKIEKQEETKDDREKIGLAAQISGLGNSINAYA